jgi:CDP-paratose 2-epimerase
VYNAGGGRKQSISVREAIGKIEKLLRKKAKITYNDKNRSGDHLWYISDVSKFKKHYPQWDFEYTLDRTLEEICGSKRDTSGG